MRRDDFQHFRHIAIAERQALRHLIHVSNDAFALRPRYMVVWRAAKRDPRAQARDRKPDAAETTTETAIKVEETQMQSRRNRHRYAPRRWAGRAPQEIRSPGFLTLASSGFPKTNTGLQCATPGQVGNLDMQKTLGGGPM